jgi:hypothetical protein
MHKTFVFLLATLVVSIMGIGVAYLMGQQTAAERLRGEIERSREEQRALIDELKRDLAPRPAENGVMTAPVETRAAEPTPKSAESPAAETPAPPEPKQEEPEPLVVAEALPEAESEPNAPEPVDAAPEGDARGASQPEEASEAESGPETVEPPAPPIARESFEAVALGTLYADVAQRFGREGLAALTMQDATGTETKHYFWDWIGTDGQACRVTMRFVDGRLMDKIYRD